MKTVSLQTKKILSAVLIASQLLSVSTAEAGLLDMLGITSSEPAQPTEPATTGTTPPPTESKPAPRPAKPRARLAQLGDGNADGIMDDNERELFDKNETKADGANEIGQYTVTEDQPLYSLGGTNARVIGHVKKDEVFTVTVPGERYATVRLKNGNIGFIDKSKIVADGRKEAIERELAPPSVLPRTPARPNRKLEAGCDNCDARVDLPNAVEQKQIGGIAEVSRRLNNKRNQRPTRTEPAPVFPANGRTSTKVAKLISAARYQAVRPRVPARFLWNRRGSRAISGNQSKGKCWAAVKDALLQAGIFKKRPGTEAARNAGPDLKRAGMTNVISSMRSKIGGNLTDLAWQAPVGSVLVYEGGGHGYGHIEIKTADKQYCSDFCQSRPVNALSRNPRRLIGIYTL